MILLSDSASAPKRIVLGDGAWIELRPCGSLDLYQARDKIKPLIASLVLGNRSRDDIAAVLGPEFGEPNTDDPHFAAAASERLALIEIVTLCATAWEGIANADGTPAELSRVNIARLLRETAIAETINANVSAPILERRAEKNASAASPNGGAAVEPNSA